MRINSLSVSIQPHNQQKQIDNRWNQLKFSYQFSSRSNFGFTSQGSIAYLHGGYNTDQGILGDMYTANFDEQQHRTWQSMPQYGKNKPGKLRNHILLGYRNFLICVGGQQSIMQNNTKIYKYNLRNNTWNTLKIQSNTIPKDKIINYIGKDSHVGFISQNSMYIFGGYQMDAGQYTNTILQFDLSKMEKQDILVMKEIQINGSKPSPRGNCGACKAGKFIYIFGGTNSHDIFDDFWVFDCAKLQWTEICRKNNSKYQYWPQKRKGAVLGYHEETGNIFMFGGLKQITKQQNDVSIYIPSKTKWIKIHSTTNNIYDPSPTLKKQIEDSPTILQSKRKKILNKQFKLGIKTIQNQQTKYLEEQQIIHQKNKTIQSGYKTHHNNNFRSKLCKTQFTNLGKNQRYTSVNNHYKTKQSLDNTALNFKKKPSVVQEKKYREFLFRKRKLLNQITKGYNPKAEKRPVSPVTQCIQYSLNQIGDQIPKENHKGFRRTMNARSTNYSHQIQNQQQHEPKNIHNFQIPKVIFDINRNIVIGKKPCARDGHATFVYKQDIYIIGGDRHTVSFNDTYSFRMDKGIQSVSFYT